ncbi:MAG: hypothetical protein HY960_10490 [Ignavibacteriae bacterium]|nr:hypothetical protein [Ignavibacteriota bacterium]
MTQHIRNITIICLILLCVLFPEISSSQVKIKLPLIIADGGGSSTGKRDTLWFGYHPDATFCIDAPLTFGPCDVIKEYEAPPAPPEGVFDVRFTKSRSSEGTCLGQGVYDNIHSFVSSDPDTFRLRLQPSTAGGFPFRLFWVSNLSLYFDSARIQYSSSTGTIRVNMLTTSSHDITDAEFSNLRMIVKGMKGSQIAPTAPILQQPPNGATKQSPSLTLSWGTVANTVLYEVEVATDSLFTNIVFTDTAHSTSKAVSGLPESQKLFWHVRAMSEVLSGCYQDVPFSFITRLGPPQLSSPSEGDNTVPTEPMLRWRRNIAATVYNVQVSRNNTFTDIVTTQATADTFFQVGTLSHCNPYYWRVNALNATDTSAFSSARSFTVIDTDPGQPSLVNPLDSTIVVGDRPTLSWTGDICSRTYLVEIAADTGFTQILLSQSLTQTSYQTPNLEGEENYFWRVTAKNGLNVFGPRSVTRMFTTPVVIPSPPALAQPPNAGPPVPDTTIIFVWNRARNKPLSYVLELSKNSNFTAIVKRDTVADTTTTISSLDYCTRYYWRVNARNSAGTGQFSPVFVFDVRRNIPRLPLIVSPVAPSDTGVTDEPTLRWRGDACTQGYVFQVSLDSMFTTLLYDEALADTQKKILATEPYTWYYWRVKATNDLGDGAFQETKFRTVRLTRPKAPLLFSPDSTTLGVLQYPVMCWDSSRRTESYRLQVALDTNFTILVFNDSTLTTLCKQVGPLLFSKTYYWRVNAKNEAGTSEYSTVWWFKTLFPPEQSNLIHPENGVTGVSVTPELQWSIPDRADSYHLQVAKDAAFTTIVYNDTSIQTQSWQLYNLDNRTWYYWRVRAKNTAGYGPFSSVNSFKTTIVGVADWVTTLSVSETGFGKDTVYFGLHPNATHGIDPRIGEFELPQVSTGQFDLRFVDIPSRPNQIRQGLRLNRLPFKTYGQVDSFKVAFQLGTGEYPIHISWNSSFIRGICDSMIIMDMFGGLTLRERMDLVSTAVLTNISTKSLLIISYGAYPTPTDVEPEPEIIPEGFVLSKNYPNPFNPSTQINFSNEEAALIYIGVFDVLGREVSRLLYSEIEPGNHSISWNGENTQGAVMPSGIYYVRMIATAQGTRAEKPFVSSQKMVLLK